MKGRLEPFLRADAALEAEGVGVGPGAELAHFSNRGIDLPGVGIAPFHQAHGQAVGAEENMDTSGVFELREGEVNPLDQRLNVERMVEKVFYDAGRAQAIGAEAAPLLQAAERGGVGIVRVERE